MKQELFTSQVTIKDSSEIIIAEGTLVQSIAFGKPIQKFTGPMYFKYIHPLTGSNGSVEIVLVGSSPIQLCSPASTSAESLSPSWIDSLRKFLTVTQISLSVWAILLSGLWLVALVSGSSVGQLSEVLIALVVINFSLHIIQQACSVSGKTAPPPSST